MFDWFVESVTDCVYCICMIAWIALGQPAWQKIISAAPLVSQGLFQSYGVCCGVVYRTAMQTGTPLGFADQLDNISCKSSVCGLF